MYAMSDAKVQDFNPRSREGSDVMVEKPKIQAEDFNPRSREGSDSLSRNGNTHTDYFNPRSREGSDKYQVPKHDN